MAHVGGKTELEMQLDLQSQRYCNRESFDIPCLKGGERLRRGRAGAEGSQWMAATRSGDGSWMWIGEKKPSFGLFH